MFNATSSTQTPYAQVLAGLTFASLRETISSAELRQQAGPVIVTDVEQLER